MDKTSVTEIFKTIVKQSIQDKSLHVWSWNEDILVSGRINYYNHHVTQHQAVEWSMKINHELLTALNMWKMFSIWLKLFIYLFNNIYIFLRWDRFSWDDCWFIWICHLMVLKFQLRACHLTAPHGRSVKVLILEVHVFDLSIGTCCNTSIITSMVLWRVVSNLWTVVHRTIIGQLLMLSTCQDKSVFS